MREWPIKKINVKFVFESNKQKHVSKNYKIIVVSRFKF